MNRFKSIFFLLSWFALPVVGWSSDRMMFWNLTGTKITKLYLAPAGTTKWSTDQCANDPDGSVDPDERLKLVGLVPGHYDVKLTDAEGRTCVVKNVTLESGRAYAFSISESELKDCSK
jgi:hypothetical protein